MNGPELLKIAGQIAGIGGLAIGAFIILFREVIRKNIFPNLVKEQAYRLLILIVILVWLVAISGVGAWAYVETIKNNKPSSGDPNSHQVAGLVTDDVGIGLPDVDVFVVGEVARTKTTSSGDFILILKGEEGRVVNLQAVKNLYTSWNENIKVPNTNIRITLRKPNDLPINNKQNQNNDGTHNSITSNSTRPNIGKKQPPQKATPPPMPSGIIQQKSGKPSSGGQNE
jgi:hypothetical protein